MLKGEIALYLIKVENWDNPSRDIEPYLYKLNEIESLDINSEFEFSFAEFLFKKKNF